MALRYSWDPRIQEFVPWPGVRKLILLVDGTWCEGELDDLAHAGWGVITHPREIARLVEAVFSSVEELLQTRTSMSSVIGLCPTCVEGW
jgi:hypothetical protein